MKCSAASIRKRIERLEQAQAQRAAMGHKAEARRADVQLTASECIAALSAMRGYFGEYWQAEGCTEAGRDATLAYIDEGIARLELEQAGT